MENSLIKWREDFIFRGKKLFYNRIQYNNFAERAVEIPIAFDFLANLRKQYSILEVGNVLSNYENSLSDYFGIRSRRIIDKFEVGLGIENIDLMEFPDEEKYYVIVSISTIEHVGQGISPLGDFGERKMAADLEAPLKAIAKIYDMLHVGGKALITGPFGKLTDGDWFIQFSTEYLNLLITKFGIPKEALSVSFLRRIATQLNPDNPYQLWIEADEKELSKTEYNGSWDGAGAVAVIELTKVSDRFLLSLNVPPTPLIYEPPILIGSVYYSRFTHPIKPDKDGEICSERRGLIFHGSYNDIPVGDYELIYSIQVDVPCDLLFDVMLKNIKSKEKVLKHYICRSDEARQIIKISSEQTHIEFRLFNRSGDRVKIRVQKFILRSVKSVMT